MKVKDFFKPAEDECDLCALHTQAKEKVSDDEAATCPHCDEKLKLTTIISELEDGDIEVVGEGAYADDPNQNVTKRVVFRCPCCYDPIAVELRPVIHNPGHDVLYFGKR